MSNTRAQSSYAKVNETQPISKDYRISKPKTIPRNEPLLIHKQTGFSAKNSLEKRNKGQDYQQNKLSGSFYKMSGFKQKPQQNFSASDDQQFMTEDENGDNNLPKRSKPQSQRPQKPETTEFTRIKDRNQVLNFRQQLSHIKEGQRESTGLQYFSLQDAKRLLYLQNNECKQQFNRIASENRKLDTRVKQVRRDKERLERELQTLIGGTGRRLPGQKHALAKVELLNSLKATLRARRQQVEELEQQYRDLKTLLRADNLNTLANEGISLSNSLAQLKNEVIRIKTLLSTENQKQSIKEDNRDTQKDVVEEEGSLEDLTKLLEMRKKQKERLIDKQIECEENLQQVQQTVIEQTNQSKEEMDKMIRKANKYKEELMTFLRDKRASLSLLKSEYEQKLIEFQQLKKKKQAQSIFDMHNLSIALPAHSISKSALIDFLKECLLNHVPLDKEVFELDPLSLLCIADKTDIARIFDFFDRQAQQVISFLEENIKDPNLNSFQNAKAVSILYTKVKDAKLERELLKPGEKGFQSLLARKGFRIDEIEFILICLHQVIGKHVSCNIGLTVKKLLECLQQISTAMHEKLQKSPQVSQGDGTQDNVEADVESASQQKSQQSQEESESKKCSIGKLVEESKEDLQAANEKDDFEDNNEFNDKFEDSENQETEAQLGKQQFVKSIGQGIAGHEEEKQCSQKHLSELNNQNGRDIVGDQPSKGLKIDDESNMHKQQIIQNDEMQQEKHLSNLGLNSTANDEPQLAQEQDNRQHMAEQIEAKISTENVIEDFVEQISRNQQELNIVKDINEQQFDQNAKNQEQELMNNLPKQQQMNTNQQTIIETQQSEAVSPNKQQAQTIDIHKKQEKISGIYEPISSHAIQEIKEKVEIIKSGQANPFEPPYSKNYTNQQDVVQVDQKNMTFGIVTDTEEFCLNSRPLQKQMIAQAPVINDKNEVQKQTDSKIKASHKEKPMATIDQGNSCSTMKVVEQWYDDTIQIIADFEQKGNQAILQDNAHHIEKQDPSSKNQQKIVDEGNTKQNDSAPKNHVQANNDSKQPTDDEVIQPLDNIIGEQLCLANAKTDKSQKTGHSNQTPFENVIDRPTALQPNLYKKSQTIKPVNKAVQKGAHFSITAQKPRLQDKSSHSSFKEQMEQTFDYSPHSEQTEIEQVSGLCQANKQMNVPQQIINNIDMKRDQRVFDPNLSLKGNEKSLSVAFSSEANLVITPKTDIQNKQPDQIINGSGNTGYYKDGQADQQSAQTFELLATACFQEMMNNVVDINNQQFNSNFQPEHQLIPKNIIQAESIQDKCEEVKETNVQLTIMKLTYDDNQIYQIARRSVRKIVHKALKELSKKYSCDGRHRITSKSMVHKLIQQVCKIKNYTYLTSAFKTDSYGSVMTASISVPIPNQSQPNKQEVSDKQPLYKHDQNDFAIDINNQLFGQKQKEEELNQKACADIFEEYQNQIFQQLSNSIKQQYLNNSKIDLLSSHPGSNILSLIPKSISTEGLNSKVVCSTPTQAELLNKNVSQLNKESVSVCYSLTHPSALQTQKQNDQEQTQRKEGYYDGQKEKSTGKLQQQPEKQLKQEQEIGNVEDPVFEQGELYVQIMKIETKDQQLNQARIRMHIDSSDIRVLKMENLQTDQIRFKIDKQKDIVFELEKDNKVMTLGKYPLENLLITERTVITERQEYDLGIEKIAVVYKFEWIAGNGGKTDAEDYKPPNFGSE